MVDGTGGVSDVQALIDLNIDTSSALAGLKALEAGITELNAKMASGSAASAKTFARFNQTLLNSLNSTGKFSAGITQVTSASEAFTNSLERNEMSMRQFYRYALATTSKMGSGFKSEMDTIDKVVQSRVKTLQTRFINLGRDANGVMQAISVRPLTLNLEDAGVKAQMAAQKVQIFNELVRQGSTQLLNWGKNTQWAGRQLMVGFTLPLTMMGAAAAKAFMDLEKQTIAFKRVYGDFNTTAAQTDAMAKSIQGLAAEFTKYGVSVVETMDLAAKAAAMGKTGADLTAQVSETTRLAVLGQVDQQQALETTISLTNAFGTASDELAGKIDFLNAVENQTVTSIEDLTVAIPKAGPVIKQMGGNVEDLAFFLTAMREGGINASEGANALKSGIAAIINPTKEASDMLSGFGINIQQLVESNKGDIKGLITDFAGALDKLDPLSRARAIEQMFGKFQFARLSTLFQNVIKDGSQANKVLELTKSTSQELALLSQRELARVSESTTYRFEKAITDFQMALAPVGEQFLELATPIIEFGTKILKWFDSLSEGGKKFGVAVVAGIGIIAPALIMVIGLLANATANFVKFVQFFGKIGYRIKNGLTDGISATRYLSEAELKAEAQAAALDQSHANLIQRLGLEKESVLLLAQAYKDLFAAQGGFHGTNSGINIAGGLSGGLAGGLFPTYETAGAHPAKLQNINIHKSHITASPDIRSELGQEFLNSSSLAGIHPDFHPYLTPVSNSTIELPGSLNDLMKTGAKGATPQQFTELYDQLTGKLRSNLMSAGLLMTPEIDQAAKLFEEELKQRTLQLHAATKEATIYDRHLIDAAGQLVKEYKNEASTRGEIARRLDFQGLLGGELRVANPDTIPTGQTETTEQVLERLSKDPKNNIYKMPDGSYRYDAKSKGAEGIGFKPGTNVRSGIGKRLYTTPDGEVVKTKNYNQASYASEVAGAAKPITPQQPIRTFVMDGKIYNELTGEEIGLAPGQKREDQTTSPTVPSNLTPFQQRMQDIIDRKRATRARRIVGNRQYRSAMADWKRSGPMKETYPIGQQIAGGISDTSKAIQNEFQKLATNANILKLQITDKAKAIGKTISGLFQRAKAELAPEYKEFADTLRDIGKTISDRIKSATNSIKNTFDKAKGYVTSAFQKTMLNAKAIKDKISDTLNKAMQPIKSAFEKAKGYVTSSFQKLTANANIIKAKISDVLSKAIQSIKSTFDKAKSYVTPALQKFMLDANIVKTKISNGLNKAIQSIRSTFDKAKGYVTSTSQKIVANANIVKTKISNGLNKAIQSIRSTFDKVKGYVTPALQKFMLDANIVKTKVSDGLAKAMQPIKSIFDKAKLYVTPALQKLVTDANIAKTKVSDGLTKAMQSIKSTFDKAKSYVTPALQKLVTDTSIVKTQISDKANVVQKSINDIASNLKTKLGQLLTPLSAATKSIAKSIGQKMKPISQSISGAFNSLKTNITGALNNFVNVAKKMKQNVVGKAKQVADSGKTMFMGLHNKTGMKEKPTRGAKGTKPSRQDYAGARTPIGERLKNFKSGVQKRYQKFVGGNRIGMAGGGFGIGMGLSGAGTIASMMGNEKVGSGLQTAGTIGMAVGSIGMLIQPLKSLSYAMGALFGVSAGLGGAIFAVVAALGVLAFMAWQHSEDMKKIASEAKVVTDGLGASQSSMTKMAEAQGKVLPSDVLAQQRADAFAGITRKDPGVATTGETYLTTDAGKSLTDSIKKATETGLSSAFTSTQIAQQLASGISNGLMTSVEAISIADAISSQFDNYKLGVDIKGKLTELIGVDGKDVFKNGIDLKVRLIQDVSNPENNPALPILTGPDIPERKMFPDTMPKDTTEAVQNVFSPFVTIWENIKDSFGLGITAEQKSANIGVESSILSERVAVTKQAIDDLEVQYKNDEISLQQYNNAREELLKAGTDAYQRNWSDIQALTDEQRNQLSDSLSTSITNKFEGTDQAAYAASALSNLKDFGQTAQLTIKASIDAGALSPTAFDNIFNVLGGNEQEVSKAMSLDVRFGSGTTEMLGQVLPFFDPEKAPEIAKNISVSVTGMEELNVLYDVISDPTLTEQERDITLKVLTEADNEKLKQIASAVNKFKALPKVTMRSVKSLIVEAGGDWDVLKGNWEWFMGLEDSYQVQYIQEFMTIYSTIDETDAGYPGWKAQRADKGLSTDIGAYRAAKVQKLTEDIKNQVKNNPTGTTTDPGGSGTPSKPGGGKGGKAGGDSGGSDSGTTDTAPKDPKGDALKKKQEFMQKQLDIISAKEKKINDVYARRKEALQKIADLQKSITQQQRDQLDLANALSSGDIAAAAKAAQQLKTNAAQRAIDMQQRAIDTAQQNQLKAITVDGLTREQLELKLDDLALQIAEHELTMLKKEKPAGLELGVSHTLTPEEHAANRAAAQARKAKRKGNISEVVTASMGGMIKYFAGGGFASLGTDTIPAMLTPGEFVVRRPAAQSFGIRNLESINNGSYQNGSVYNYDVSVNVSSNSNPDEIARVVVQQIKNTDSYHVRGNRL